MLNIHIKPDATTAAEMVQREKQEAEEKSLKDNQMVLKEFKMGKILGWAPENYQKDRHLSMREKRFFDAMQGFLAIKAQNRQEKCWMHSLGCTRQPHVWVHEIGFDLKELKAGLEFAQANTASKTGDVPGFCMFHLAEGPAMLAERVYYQDTLVQWGYLPSRWYCKFTDGTSTRGPIKQINPTLAQPDIIEEHIRNT